MTLESGEGECARFSCIVDRAGAAALHASSQDEPEVVAIVEASSSYSRPESNVKF
jgi:hypothetical protein